jgi:uncharacterized membrane protein YphA (DoxX/SURF4 family)
MSYPSLISNTESEFGIEELRSKLRLMKWGLRVIVGSTFAVSGILKTAYQDKFVEALRSYQFIPDFGIDLAALALPQIEIVLGLMLAFGIKTRAVSRMILLMLVIFSALGAAAIASGQAIDCGCFPVPGTSEPVGPSLLVRNGLMILSCLWIASGHSQPKKQ